MSDPSTGPWGGGRNDDGYSCFRYLERFLSIANISRIMKKANPDDGKITKITLWTAGVAANSAGGGSSGKEDEGAQPGGQPGEFVFITHNILKSILYFSFLIRCKENIYGHPIWHCCTLYSGKPKDEAIADMVFSIIHIIMFSGPKYALSTMLVWQKL
jgi:hypothetical protein